MFRKPKSRPNAALQNAIVTSDAVKSKPKLNLGRLSPQKRELPSKPVLIGIGVIAFVFIAPALIFLFLWLGDASRGNSETAVCRESLLKDANKQIEANDITELSKISEKVQKLKHHETDPNCEYILVRYAITTGNTTEAKTQLALLKKAYTSSYSDVFTQPAFSPDELEALINQTAANQSEVNQQAEQNMEDQGEMNSQADALKPKGTQ
jgi:hypothetical protein